MKTRKQSAIVPWLVAAGVASVSLHTHAQSTDRYPECAEQPTESDIAAAKGAFQAGQAAFNEADYERAVLYWEDAYRRDCTAHALLLNLARAHELQGDRQSAVFALETFLARKPDVQHRDQIERRIEVLNQQIAEQQAAPTSEPAPAPAAPPPPQAPEPEVVHLDAATPDAPAGRRPVLPLIVGGAGVVIFAVGGILWLDAVSDVNEAEDACGGRVCPTPELKETGDEARTRWNVTGAVSLAGLGIAAGSAVWYLLSEPEPRARAAQPAFSPELSRSYAGVRWSGAF